MPYKSFESLLSKFPYFLNKNWDSNFSKSERVFNSEFKKVYNNLYDVYLASKLRKHVLIWKEQNSGYNYDMYFAVSFPNLKSVCITEHYIELVSQEVVLDDGSIKINESMQEISKDIYTETFNYDDFVNHFEYLHSNTSQTIIPTEKYTITIETWDEYTTTKGFPENPIIVGDEYDHDYSLDAFGEYFRCPRRTYNEVKTSQYSDTIPAYDNQVTEDDYHYMQRLLYYATHLNDTPLPILEIFKLFSITDAQLLNRERLLCRMIDITRHSKDGVYNRTWKPQRWEHKDKWCNGLQENLFLFANANNNNPIQGQKFVFDFKVLNSLGEEVYNTNSYNLIEETVIDETEKSWIIIPYINNEVVADLILDSQKKWSLTTKDINEEDTLFIFKCFSTIEEAQQDILENNGKFKANPDDLISEEILIHVIGCNHADYYVSEDGNDDNDGVTKETAFKTVNKALNMVEGEKNIISLLDGEHHLNTALITQNTTILACPQFTPTLLCDNLTFFRISQDTQLTLQNIDLKSKCCKMHAGYTVFKNNNNLNYPLNVRVAGKFCLISTSIVLDSTVVDEWIVLHDYRIVGHLVKSDGESHDEYTTQYTDSSCVEEDTLNSNKSKNSLTGEKVQLLKNRTVISETTVDKEGLFTFTVNSGGIIGSDNYQVVHDETELFCNSTSENITRNVVKTTPKLILETDLFYTGVNKDLQIPFKVKMDTDTEITGEQLRVTLNNDGSEIDEAFIAFEADNTADGVLSFTSAIIGTNTLEINVEGNTYINTISKNIQVIVENITRELVDGATTLNNGFYFVETLPEDLTEYNVDDVLVTLDNTGEHMLYITDAENDDTAPTSDDDEVWINTTNSIDQLIRDKRTEE